MAKARTSQERSGSYLKGRGGRAVPSGGPGHSSWRPRQADNRLTVQATSFEANGTPWTSANADVTFSQVSEINALHGARTGKLTRINTPGFVEMFSGVSGTIQFRLEAGMTVYSLWHVYSPGVARTFRADVRFYTAARANISTPTGPNVTVPPDRWVEIRSEIVAVPTTGFANPRLVGIDTFGVGEFVYVDKVAADILPFVEWAPGLIL